MGSPKNKVQSDMARAIDEARSSLELEGKVQQLRLASPLDEGGKQAWNSKTWHQHVSHWQSWNVGQEVEGSEGT